MISLICGISKTKTNEQAKQNRNRPMDTENKLIVAKREVGGKMDEIKKKQKTEPRYLDTGGTSPESQALKKKKNRLHIKSQNLELLQPAYQHCGSWKTAYLQKQKEERKKLVCRLCVIQESSSRCKWVSRMILEGHFGSGLICRRSKSFTRPTKV